MIHKEMANLWNCMESEYT